MWKDEKKMGATENSHASSNSLPPADYCLPPTASLPPEYRIEGNGPVLIYIPGLDGTGELFFKQSPGLVRTHRVVTFRLREHGSFTYDDLADDVAAIISAIGERRATLVAESFGGGVALTFALRYPAMIEQLVLVNTFARYRERVRIRLGARLASILPFQLLWYLRKSADLLGLLVDDVAVKDRSRFFEAIRTVKREAYARRLKLICDLDIEDRLSEIETPTLIIACEKDLVVRSTREARLMAACLPNATVKIFKDAGHACLLGSQVHLDEILARHSVSRSG